MFRWLLKSRFLLAPCLKSSVSGLGLAPFCGQGKGNTKSVTRCCRSGRGGYQTSSSYTIGRHCL